MGRIFCGCLAPNYFCWMQEYLAPAALLAWVGSGMLGFDEM